MPQRQGDSREAWRRKPKTLAPRGKNLRSQLWFDNPDNPGMTALYLERYLNFGLTAAELRSGKPIIGIAQTGSDLSPCNRHHLELAKRVREGIRDAGGIAFEFPVHPIQETGKRPTAALDRNLAYLGLVEVLYGYPLDGVVLTDRLRQDHAGLHHGGRDREHPGDRALRRADAQRLVEGRARRLRHGGLEGARGAGRRPDRLRGVHRHRGLVGAVGRPLQHHGHGLDHERARRGARHVAAGLRRDPGALPRARRRSPTRPACARSRWCGRTCKPSDILTREAFENAIVANSAIGGSTNAPIHINAIARHIGVKLDDRGLGDDRLRRAAAGQHAAGRQISRRGILPRRRRAGGDERAAARPKRIHDDALTVNGKTMGENVKRAKIADADVIRPTTSR